MLAEIKGYLQMNHRLFLCNEEKNGNYFSVISVIFSSLGIVILLFLTNKLSDKLGMISKTSKKWTLLTNAKNEGMKHISCTVTR